MSRVEHVSVRAGTRMRAFNAAITVCGLLLTTIIGWSTLASGAIGEISTSGGTTTSEDFYDPWENPSPTAATADGETWSGRGQQYIPLTGLTPGRPLVLTMLEDSEISDFFLTEGAAGDSGAAVSFDSYSDIGHYMVPSASEMTLWLRVRTADPWSVRVKPADLEERTGTVSGTAPQTFLYTGPATTARVRVSGHVTVDIVTENGIENDYRWLENESQSIAWGDTRAAIFTMDSSGDSSWSIEFFEPAPESTSAPEPAPEPTPTSTPTTGEAADE